jgi:hypothetical protein
MGHYGHYNGSSGCIRGGNLLFVKLSLSKTRQCSTQFVETLISYSGFMQFYNICVRRQSLYYLHATYLTKLKSNTFWDIMLCNLFEVRNVSEKHIASIFRVE